MRTVLLIPLLLALPASPVAPRPEPTAEQIEEDVGLFRWLASLELSAEQAQNWAQHGAEAAAALADLRAKWNAPAVRAAMLVIREATLHGEPVTDAMQSAVWRARAEALGQADPDDLDDLDDLARNVIQPHLELMLMGLEPGQLLCIASPYLAGRADDWYEFIRDGLAIPPDRWQERLDEALRDVRDDRDEDGEQVAEELAEFAARVRGMAVQQIHDRAVELRRELLEILAPQLEPAALREAARDRLADMLAEHERLPICLADWAAAQVR